MTAHRTLLEASPCGLGQTLANNGLLNSSPPTIIDRLCINGVRDVGTRIRLHRTRSLLLQMARRLGYRKEADNVLPRILTLFQRPECLAKFVRRNRVRSTMRCNQLPQHSLSISQLYHFLAIEMFGDHAGRATLFYKC